MVFYEPRWFFSPAFSHSVGTLEASRHEMYSSYAFFFAAYSFAQAMDAAKSSLIQHCAAVAASATAVRNSRSLGGIGKPVPYSVVFRVSQANIATISPGSWNPL